MTAPRQQIPSGLGARTTAQDVLSGIDLTGQLAVVTDGWLVKFGLARGSRCG